MLVVISRTRAGDAVRDGVGVEVPGVGVKAVGPLAGAPPVVSRDDGSWAVGRVRGGRLGGVWWPLGRPVGRGGGVLGEVGERVGHPLRVAAFVGRPVAVGVALQPGVQPGGGDGVKRPLDRGHSFLTGPSGGAQEQPALLERAALPLIEVDGPAGDVGRVQPACQGAGVLTGCCVTGQRVDRASRLGGLLAAEPATCDGAFHVT